MPDWRAAAREFLAAARVDAGRADEVAEELAQHLEARYQEHIGAGATAAEAERATRAELDSGAIDDAWQRLGRLRRDLGSAVPLGAGSREAAGLGAWLAGLGRDFRYAGRLLARSPGFTAVAILSLALGIGANAAIFNLLDALALRPLPVANPQQLAEIRIEPHREIGNAMGPDPQLTYPLWQRVAAGQRAFTSLAAWSTETLRLSGAGEVRLINGLWVSGSFFPLLGVPPAQGRLLSPGDDQPGCHAPGAVLSYGYWQSAYGGANVIGRMLPLQGYPVPILGVAAKSFSGLQPGVTFDVALPLCAEPLVDGAQGGPDAEMLNRPQDWWLAAIGRLRPGSTLQEASAQLAAISPAIFAATVPADYRPVDRAQYLRYRLAAVPAGHGIAGLGGEYDGLLWLLLGLAGVVLLIACANLANLMLARAGSRRRELALRLAVGASRRHILRQLTAESALLAAAGAACGAGLAALASRGLVGLLGTERFPVFLRLALDWRVLGLLAALAALACLLFGIVPALGASRIAPAEALKAGGRGVLGGAARLRRGLVVAQVALSLVLLVTGLLFAATLRNLLGVADQFAWREVALIGGDLTPLALPVGQRSAYRQKVLARLGALPGVTSATLISSVPAEGDIWNSWIEITGAGTKNRLADFNAISPGYFRTFGTGLLAGRNFSPSDTPASPAVAIVTAAFSRQFLEGANPIGRTLRLVKGPDKLGPPIRIVGVARDEVYRNLRETPPPIVFLDAAQSAAGGPEFVVALRSGLPAVTLRAEVSQAFTALDPRLQFFFGSLSQTIRGDLLRERLMAMLGGCFAALAALLALVGLYGVIAYLIVRRRNEIAVRMALGATRAGIVALVLREAALLLGAGLAIGALLAWLAGGTVRSMLYGVRPADARTFAAAIVGLAAAGVLAVLLPARRAAALDPMRLLREE